MGPTQVYHNIPNHMHMMDVHNQRTKHPSGWRWSSWLWEERVHPPQGKSSHDRWCKF